MINPPPVISLLVVTLAVWRLTHLLWAEDGPGDIFVRLRRLAGDGFFGRLLDCFYCLSLWVAVPFAWLLGGTWLDRGVLWFSLSGGAILLERATARIASAPATPPAIWHETPSEEREENKDDVMLR